ncbi:MAG: hypothetical protein ACFFD7_01370 [Candidatus Thorarchaeota archaeon]
MSKVRKQRIDRKRAISEIDIKFEKIIQFSGWMFLLGLGAFMGGWVLLDDILHIITLSLNEMTFSFIIFIGTNSAVSFGLASKIKSTPEKKKSYFLDWLLGELLFCMFAIFAVAAYQW